MIKAKVNWNGAKVLDSVRAKSWEGLARCVAFYHSAVLAALNVSAGPLRVKRTRNTPAGKKGSTYTTYTNPSKPGEPPHKRTGWLQRNIKMQLDQKKGEGRVGVMRNAFYGAILELRMDRSFLLATLTKNRARLAILASS